MQVLRKYAVTIVFAAAMLLVVLQFGKILAIFDTVFSAVTTVIIGLVIAFVMNLPMSWLEQHVFSEKRMRSKRMRKLRRPISIFLTFLMFSLALLMLSWFIFPQLYDSFMSFVENAPSHVSEIASRLLAWADSVGIRNEQIAEMLGRLPNLFKNITNITASTIGGIWQAAMQVSSAALNVFLGMVLSIYMLSSKESLMRGVSRLNRAIFPPEQAAYLSRVAEKANFLFSKFVGGQLTEAVILGTLCFVGMSILRFPYALLVSTLIGVTALIPYVGAFLGTIPSLVIISLSSLPQGLGFLVFILLLQQFDGNFIYPKVVGDAIGLDGFWVLVAISVGGSLFGIVGMLAGVPLLALIQVLIGEWVDRRLTHIEKQGVHR